jgi:hypothetical protein
MYEQTKLLAGSGRQALNHLICLPKKRQVRLRQYTSVTVFVSGEKPVKCTGPDGEN